MPFCMNCGHEIPEEAKFCASCGTATGTIKKEESQRKTTYDGEIHKCPNCGEVLKSFMPNCPLCGYEIRSVNSSNSPVNELARRIENATSLEMKVELITNFYVPNTKEDIYEFFILAVSNLEDTNYDTDDAWQVKLEQTYHKAKLLFGKSSEFEYVDELYKKTIAKISKRGTMTFLRKNKQTTISVLLVIIGIIMIAIGIVIISSVSIEENWGAFYGGAMLLLLGMIFLFGFFENFQSTKENEKNVRENVVVDMDKLKKSSKETVDSVCQNYADIAEQFKSMGSKKK